MLISYLIKVVAEDMMQLRKHEGGGRPEKYNSDLFKSNRGSIAAYMYGSRLSQYIKKLEQVKVFFSIIERQLILKNRKKILCRLVH